MNKRKEKTVIISFFVILCLIAIPIQNMATISEPVTSTKQVSVTIYNVHDQTSRVQTMDFDLFMSFFEPIDADSEQQLHDQLQLKWSELQDGDLFTSKEKDLISEMTTKSISNTRANVLSKGLFFDLLNVFNGFGFAIKGEKTRSFLDLPVARFPFLNTNITALFSGFNSFEGDGFIFTLGTNGFRYIYNYDKDVYDFPYFSSINGFFIGYTGVILEATVSDIFGETYAGTYIIGIGMNVITLWND